MKKFIITLFVLFGVVIVSADRDLDGVADEKDICPRVYARSETGCPTLTVVKPREELNICFRDFLEKGTMLVILKPICDEKTKTCPNILSVKGVQSCDPLFPVILESDGSLIARGGLFVLDYKK